MSDLIVNGNNIPNIGGPKADPRDYETIHCDKCGGFSFVNQYVLKKVSGVELGMGSKPMMIPLNILVCAKCGAILSDDIKGYKLEDDMKIAEEFNKNKEKNNLLL